MTDNANMFTGNHTASVTAYRADGWKVFFSFVLAGDDPVGSANAQIAALAANGYTPNAPGLEAGERTEEIVSVSRREFIGRDGKAKRALDMWTESGQYHQYSDYMDDAIDFESFTAVTGLDYNKLPVREGVNAAARRDPNSEAKIVDLSRPAQVVYKVTGLTDKGKEKKEFVRWHGITLTTPTVDAPAPAANVTPFPPPQTGNALDAAGLPSANANRPVPPAIENTLNGHWTKTRANVGKFFTWADDEFELNTMKVLEILNVKAISQYTGSYDDAVKAISATRMKEAS